MPPMGFEPTISAGEWPKTYTLDCAATRTGTSKLTGYIYLYRKENGRKMYTNVTLKFWDSVYIH